ncbi:hypothetical protein HYALB_00001722 [Hymenoscyphus albidus]|uniref:Uncharacterized protein n=1 Tax=Hymenoscyphus albidus TaxID=595503 RepID=A0A9N9LBQ4_9HELO|nr:hypothetical protein HYALB_00001722 [Hymenoscyphus albidus]
MALSFFLSSLTVISVLGYTQAGAIPHVIEREVCKFDARDFNTDSQEMIARQAPSDSSQLPKTWDPPAELVAPLKQVWDRELKSFSRSLRFKNFGFDQVIAGEGKINYCVRWDTNNTASPEDRQKTEVAIQRSFKKWMDVLAGFDGWPYDTVDVKVVGWAVKNKRLLSGDTSDVDVYTNTDSGGTAECDPRCGRFFNRDGEYSQCPGGAARHYDQSLWLSDGMDGSGAGGHWGQRVGQGYFMKTIDDDSIHIVLHEIGHTFALDGKSLSSLLLNDFYDWKPTGITKFIMNAGASMVITDFDRWMLRDWWRNLNAARYKF